MVTNPFTKQTIVDNSFCPTGKGGGIDPSCGSEGKSNGSTSSRIPGFSNSQVESMISASFLGASKMKAVVRKEIKGKTWLEKFTLAAHVEERGSELGGGSSKERGASTKYANLSKYIRSRLTID